MRYLLLTKILATFFFSYSQYRVDDIKVSIEGLNREYEAKFKESLPTLVKSLNSQSVSPHLSGLELQVNYDGKKLNFIRLSVEVDPAKLFSDGQYYKHHFSYIEYGDGFSVYLIHELFEAISEYKFEIARTGSSLNLEIMSFLNAVKLKDELGNWVVFYSSNERNSRGFFPYHFYGRVDFSVDGVKMEHKPSNFRGFDELKFLWTDSLEGLGGEPTSSFTYLSSLINLTIDQFTISIIERHLTWIQPQINRNSQIRLSLL